MDKSHPEEPVLYYINPLIFLAKILPGNSCLLGLGGGAIAHALAPYLGDYPIIAVESSREIIDAAFEYFMLKRITQLEVICENANNFMTKITTSAISLKQPFKHLIIDLFNDERFPPECFNESFFSNCQKCLQPDGFIAINVAKREEHRLIFNLLKQQFASAVLCIPVKKTSNIVFFAANSGSLNTLLDCFKKNKQLKRLTWDSVWGTVAVLKS